MNRLKNVFKKIQSASSETIIVEKKQVSWLVAGIIVACFVSFVSGYFWGKRAAIEQFCQHIEGESFADQIYAAMSLNIDNEGDGEKADEEPEEVHAPEAADQDVAEEAVSEEKAGNEDQGARESKSNTQWYAQLIGFKSHQEASLFCSRLAKRDIPVIIKERLSTTARGKKVTWYQVVTKIFDSKSDLEKLTDALAYEEKIHGIRIIEC